MKAFKPGCSLLVVIAFCAVIAIASDVNADRIIWLTFMVVAIVGYLIVGCIQAIYRKEREIMLHLLDSLGEEHAQRYSRLWRDIVNEHGLAGLDKSLEEINKPQEKH